MCFLTQSEQLKLSSAKLTFLERTVYSLDFLEIGSSQLHKISVY